jgi:oligopeptide/dipeptide ABC transporter ATP-binding protein
MTTPAPGTGPTPVLGLDEVSKTFPVRGGVLRRIRSHVHAVSGVSLTLAPGETLGVVGESGSGKSTLGRLALGLLAPTAGTVSHGGHPLSGLDRRGMRAARRSAQMVFQDPYSSFDPLLSVGAGVAEPLDVHLRPSPQARRRRLDELAGLVGLDPQLLSRYPRELSGGQLQRLAVARALAAEPDVIVLDEPVSALDVSTQAQVINLLVRLQDELGVAYLLIAHNPGLVAHASHRIAVMYLGEVVELGSADEVHDRPRHPYTEALLSAVPVPSPDAQRTRQRIVLTGDIPDPAAPPPGCRFHTRCPYAMRVCHEVVPRPLRTADGGMVRCHLHTEGPELGGAPMHTLHAPTSVPFAAAEGVASNGSGHGRVT